MACESLVRPQPEKLPPTGREDTFQLLRVHHQAVVWRTLVADALDPLQLGWEDNDGKLVPVMTDLPPAPDDVLKIVRCKRKTACSSSLCSCRKHVLKCVSACNHCNGVDCTNTEPAIQWLICKKLSVGTPSAEGARIEAPQAPRGVGCGEGVSPSPMGEGSGEGAEKF